MVRVSVADGCRRLIDGEVVAIPTETVYGLAASIEIPAAVEAIFALKKRPLSNPLIIHLAEESHLSVYTQTLPPGTKELIKHFWPGPLTLVLAVDSARVPSQVRAGLPTAAFRVPNHTMALAILRQVGPLVAPSANLSGSPSATSPAHVEEDFGDNVAIVDGGPCQAGMESTILIFEEGRWQIGRLGALSPENFAEILGYLPIVHQDNDEDKPLCPGKLLRHYAPKARLILGLAPYSGDIPVVVGFSDRSYPKAQKVFALGTSTAPGEVIQNLYEILRQLDRLRIDSAWVDLQIPHQGLWLTIRERLQRAAENM